MTEDHEQPTAADDLRRWLGEATVPPDTSDRTADARTVARWSRRRVTLVAAVALPWLVTVVAVLAGDAAPSHDTQPPPPRAARAAQPTATPGPDAGHEQRSAAPPAAGPLAVGVVRDAVTGADATATTALDSAAAEPARPLGAATWLIRVHAVVLHGDRRRWRSTSHEVWAVPVGTRGGSAVALDRPWRVSRAAPSTAQIRWEPADVDSEEVRGVLRRADLPAPSTVVVERHPELPDVLRATADTPSGPTQVWLRSTPSLTVLGDVRAAAVGQ